MLTFLILQLNWRTTDTVLLNHFELRRNIFILRHELNQWKVLLTENENDPAASSDIIRKRISLNSSITWYSYNMYRIYSPNYCVSYMTSTERPGIMTKILLHISLWYQLQSGKHMKNSREDRHIRLKKISIFFSFLYQHQWLMQGVAESCVAMTWSVSARYLLIRGDTVITLSF